MQYLNHRVPVPISVLLSPEHDVINLRVVTFQEDVSSAQRHEYTVLVQRQNALSLYGEHGISVTPIRGVVQKR
jgi:hypothetical protein